jgi:DNA polymerase III subunit epsilon
MREIIFDTETTGLSASGGDRMVEIGCIELVNRVETGNNFHAYFNPCRPMPPEAQAVHGLSDAFLADKPIFADKVDELLAYLGSDAPLIAHNATFDFGFVDAELVRAGRPPLDRDRMVDTVAIARKLHPGGKHSLDSLCVRYGVDRSHRVKHGALLDAELLAHVYIEMTGGRQIGLELKNDTQDSDLSRIFGKPHPIHDPHASAPAADRAVSRPFRAPRTFPVSAQDAARHAAFVSTIAGALWQEM